MKIYYHKCSRPNFGDELNVWFWDKVFGEEFTKYNPSNSLFVGIGTVLNDKLPVSQNAYIFGSGAGYGNKIIKKRKHWDIYCVRGPLTAKVIGVSKSLAISDPAILLSDIKKMSKINSSKDSFMPHVGIDSEILKQVFEEIDVVYISPSETQDEILRKIVNSKRLITSAMHGAIIADTYRIPWYPLVTSNEILSFKWHDWCESVAVNYKPIFLPAIWASSKMSLISKLKLSIKKKILKEKVLNLFKFDNFILSEANKLQENKDKYYDKIELFKRKVLINKDN